jgi:AcrR family transcriptional regulator
VTTTADDTVSTSRPQRKDAARNHALLLAAARVVFAERGLDASLDDIARQAGLGVGTAYRHFANKQEVAAALFTQAIEQVVTVAQQAVLIEDPWEGLTFFFESVVAHQADDRGLRQVMIGTYVLDELKRIREQLTAPIEQLFQRAKDDGTLRADADPTDTGIIFSMLGAVCDMSAAGAAPQLWRRYLAIMLDGLRASGAAAPLPVRALTEAEFDVVMAATKGAGPCLPSS